MIPGIISEALRLSLAFSTDTRYGLKNNLMWNFFVAHSKPTRRYNRLTLASSSQTTVDFGSTQLGLRDACNRAGSRAGREVAHNCQVDEGGPGVNGG